VAGRVRANNCNPPKGGSQPAHKNHQQTGRPVRAWHGWDQIHLGRHQNDSYNNGEQENDRFGGNLSHNDIYLTTETSRLYCCLFNKRHSILIGLP